MASQEEEQLLLLDLNGILTDKVWDGTKNKITLLPHTIDFLIEASQKYTLGIFSSSMYWTVNDSLKLIDTAFKEREGHFIPWMVKWDRNHCEFDKESPEEHASLKILARVFDNCVANKARKWSVKNTIIVDDSPSKMRMNRPENVLIIPPGEIVTIEQVDAAFLALKLANMSGPSADGV